jgi:uncharacterized protein YwqG
MNREARLRALAEPMMRKAYVARLTSNTPARVAGSRFGGTPYAEAGDEWSMCRKCGKPEYFICQLDLRTCVNLDPPMDQLGLYVFFYCWSCYPFESKAPGWTLRNYPDAAEAKAIPLHMPADQQSWLNKFFSKERKLTRERSVEFRMIDSLPDFELFEKTAGKAAIAELEQDGEITDEYFQLTETAEQYSTQVGGHPSWVQSDPQYKCWECGADLQLLFQIASEEQADIMFGDAGVAYFLYCPQHPHVIMFESQCT